VRNSENKKISIIIYILSFYTIIISSIDALNENGYDIPYINSLVYFDIIILLIGGFLFGTFLVLYSRNLYDKILSLLLYIINIFNIYSTIIRIM